MRSTSGLCLEVNGPIGGRLEHGRLIGPAVVLADSIAGSGRHPVHLVDANGDICDLHHVFGQCFLPLEQQELCDAQFYQDRAGGVPPPYRMEITVNGMAVLPSQSAWAVAVAAGRRARPLMVPSTVIEIRERPVASRTRAVLVACRYFACPHRY